MSYTGAEILEAFKQDVESFFEPQAGFALNTVIRGMGAGCVKSGDMHFLRFGDEIAQSEINTLDELMFVLLIAGHETAHYLNKHNNYQDQGDADGRAIEIWADFYGTKVALVTTLLGSRIRLLLESLPGGKDAESRMEAIGLALGRLATTYFQTEGSRYESASLRLKTCVAGVLSVVQRHNEISAVMMGGALPTDQIVSTAMAIQLKLYGNALTRPFLAHQEGDDGSREQLAEIRRIHQQVQGNNATITQGMRAPPSLWLVTDYASSEEARLLEVDKRLQALQESLERLGYTLGDDKPT